MAIKLKKDKGILFEAIPDNGQIMASVGDNGRAQYIWPNRIVLPDDILTKLKKDAVPFLYPPRKRIEYQRVSWIVNTCADADEYCNALIGLDQAFGEKLPIFNHPRAVAMTRRDLSAKLLEGIPNLIIPKCVRFKADANNSFQKTFEVEGFKYPVLIRPATSQSSHDLVKIDTPFDWVKVYQTHWYNKYHYMTQFVDFSENGNFTKIRLCFVGGEFFLRSFRTQKSWNVKGMGGDGDGGVEEFMGQYLNFPTWHAANMLGRDLMSRVALDFWGIDLGVSRQGFFLFEANAAMTMAVASTRSARQQKLLEPVYRRVGALLKATLASPSGWQANIESRSVKAILAAN